MDQTQSLAVRRGMPLRVMAALAVHLAIIALPLIAYLLYVNARAPRVEAQYYRALNAVAGELRQRTEHLQHLFAYGAPGRPAGAEPWLARARIRLQPSAQSAVVQCGEDLARPVQYHLTADGAALIATQAACAQWADWEKALRAGDADLGDPALEQFAAALSREAGRYSQACRNPNPDAAPDPGPSGRGAPPAGAESELTSLTDCGQSGAGQVGADLAVAFAGRYAHAREVSIPLADLVPAELGQQRFDVMLLADPGGRVLYATETGWPPHLPEPAKAETAEAATPPGLAAWLGRTVRRSPSGYAYPEPFELRLGAVNWTVLCRPVDLDGSAGARGEQAQLCGAVPSARIEAATRGLAPDVLALVVLLFLLSVCVVPVLKVWLIGPAEAFRPLDLALLFVSVLFSTGLLTLLCCWGGWTLATGERLDASAQDLARQVQRAFENDLVRSGRVLAALAGDQPERELPEVIQPTAAGPTPDGGSVVYTAAADPGFGLLMRLDSHGAQVGAMGLHGLAPLSGPAQVANRSYFRAALTGRLLRPVPGSTLKVAAEQILMRGHGIHATALAAPLAAEVNSGAAVAVVVAQFAGLERPILPAGFNFAVFDADTGQVLMHSAAQRALVENFYSELRGGDAPMIARSGLSAAIDAEYDGEPHRLYLTPLAPGWPWTLAVMRSERTWRAAGFQVVAGGLPMLVLFYALFLLVLVPMAWLILRVRVCERRTFMAWVWPQRVAGCYGRVVPALVVLVGCGGLAVWRLSGFTLAGMMFLLGVLGAVVLILSARPVSGGGVPPEPRAVTCGYLASVTLLLILWGVLPAVALAKDLAQWAAVGYVRYATQAYARAAQGDGWQRLRATPRGVAGLAEGWYDAAGTVSLEQSSGPLDARWTGPCAGHPASCALAAGFAPNLADARVSALRRLGFGATAGGVDAAGQWCEAVPGADALRACGAITDELWPDGPQGLWYGLLVGLLGTGLLGLLAATAQRVCGLQMGSGRHAGDFGTDLPDAGHVLVVRARPGFAEVLRQRLSTPHTEVRIVDLRYLRMAQADPPRYTLPPESPDVLLVEEFDTGGSDPQWALARLELLEALLARGRQRLILMSEASDPARIALDGAPAERRATLALRWAQAMSGFAVLRYPPPEAAVHAHTVAERLLARETGWWWRLVPVGEAVRARPDLGGLSEDGVLRAITVRAWPEYRRIYGLCTAGERRVLSQLASGAQLNPRQAAVTEQLLRRGLVKCAPNFVLASEGFARFLRAQSDLFPDPVQSASGEGAWVSWRAPLLVAVLAVGAILLVTQRETLQTAYAIAGAALAAVPVLAQMLVRLRGLTGGGP